MVAEPGPYLRIGFMYSRIISKSQFRRGWKFVCISHQYNYYTVWRRRLWYSTSTSASKRG